MALIIDPDNMTDGVEISVLTGTFKVKLNVSGNLTASDGVTLKAVYSKLKDLWKDDANYIKFPFPMLPITDEQYELYNGWDFDKSLPVTDASATVNLVRTGGWALKDGTGTSVEEWSGIVTLGSLEFADTNGRVYYQQTATTASTNVVLQSTAGVNQAVQVYQGVSGSYTSYKPSNNIDLRTYFKIFSREYKKTYADADLGDIGVSTMTYQVYRFPLTNGNDINISVPDASMSIAPYTGMSITYFTSSQSKSGLVGGSYPFHVIISGNLGTPQQVYEFVQYQLRRNTDINAGSGNPPSTGSVTGKTANLLMHFVGSLLYTDRPAAGSGTFVDNFATANVNDLFFADDNWTGQDPNNYRYYPYSALLYLQFGSNLTSDANAIYRVFFTSGTAAGGDEFGTAGAITVQDANSIYMSGSVNGSATIVKTYDYDGNVQRGLETSATLAPITVVAIGLETAQYVKAVGNIDRSKSNTISLVAPLERNYTP